MGTAKDLVRGMYDDISGGVDVGTMLDKYVTDDFIEYEELPGMSASSGKEAARQQIGMMQAAISDLRFNVEDMVEEGNKVAARVTITGTHTGEFMGIPASGGTLDVKAIDVFEVRDGKVAAHWGVTDTAAMLMQIGAIEPPG